MLQPKDRVFKKMFKLKAADIVLMGLDDLDSDFNTYLEKKKQK